MGAVTLVITSLFQHTTNTNGNWERLGRTRGTSGESNSRLEYGMTFYLYFFFALLNYLPIRLRVWNGDRGATIRDDERGHEMHMRLES